MEEILMTLIALWIGNSLYHFLNPEKPYEPVPWNKDTQWSSGWQERLAEMAKEAEATLKTSEAAARSVREMAKQSIPPEKRDARYMPEELRKHLGLV